jgi:hypothetical protein
VTILLLTCQQCVAKHCSPVAVLSAVHCCSLPPLQFSEVLGTLQWYFLNFGVIQSIINVSSCHVDIYNCFCIKIVLMLNISGDLCNKIWCEVCLDTLQRMHDVIMQLLVAYPWLSHGKFIIS